MEGGVCNCVTTWGRREGGDYSFIPAALQKRLSCMESSLCVSERVLLFT